MPARSPLLLLAVIAACRQPPRLDSTAAAAAAAAAPAASGVASPQGDAAADAAAPDADAGVLASFPFGPATPIPRYGCGTVLKGGAFHSFLAAGDTRFAFVDGDDLLALVNRAPTGALPSSYAPSDLVDLRDGKAKSASQCETGECLRRDAAAALNAMLAAMKDAKVPGYVVSSFRGFGTQCWVFANWASQARGGFCEATEQSALPGHSQHQLGTTVDLFTADWASRGGVFRNGFGCTEGGKWLDDNAWRFGFVLPYPIHPDDRKDGSRCEARRDRAIPIDPKTGYKNEPWHLRYLGTDAATRYHAAWLASGPGTPDEITLEQWLRAERGLPGDAELPVCDGCQCGACSTLATDDAATPCGKESLRLDAQGRVASPKEPPHIVGAQAVPRPGGAIRVDVSIEAPAHTPTQPPVTAEGEPAYAISSSYLSFTPFPDAPARAFEDLPGAWRVAVEPVPPGPLPRWPWRASLAASRLSGTWNRANVVLPAKSGASVVAVTFTPPAGTRALRVTLIRGGSKTASGNKNENETASETREVGLP